MPLIGVERLDDDLRLVPVIAAGEREQDVAPAGEQLRTLRDLISLDLHDMFRLSAAVGRHAPNPGAVFPGTLLALPVENRVVVTPSYSERVLSCTQRDRRAASQRDLLDLATGPEADPLAVW